MHQDSGRAQHIPIVRCVHAVASTSSTLAAFLAARPSIDSPNGPDATGQQAYVQVSKMVSPSPCYPFYTFPFHLSIDCQMFLCNSMSYFSPPLLVWDSPFLTIRQSLESVVPAFILPVISAISSSPSALDSSIEQASTSAPYTDIFASPVRPPGICLIFCYSSATWFLVVLVSASVWMLWS